MQEEMEKAKSDVEEPNKPAESALTLDKQGSNDKTATVSLETTEVTPVDRASEIKRLKSAFTICKPQGSFLWPNMVMHPRPNKALVQLEDLFSVLTAPSVSSSTASSLSPHHLLSPLTKSGPLPNCPVVKPLPKRRPVTVTLTAAVTRPSHPLPPETITQFQTTTSTAAITTATSTKTSIIDLNEMPCPHTYRRRNQYGTKTNAIPFLGVADKDDEISQREEDGRKEILRECDRKQNESSSVSSSSSSVCLSRVSGT